MNNLKRFFGLAVMIALAVVFTMSVSSCGGDDDDEDSIWYRMTISGNNQSEYNTIKAVFEKEGVRDNMTKKGDVTKNNAEVVTACKIAALKLENEVFTEGHAVNVTASVNNGNATTIYSVSFPATAPVTNE